MIKNFKAIIPVVIALLLVVPTFSYANGTEDTGNASTPATVSEDNSNAAVTTSSTEDNGNAAITASTVEDNGNAAIGTPTVEDNGNAAIETPTLEDNGNAAIETPANNDQDSDRGSSRRRSSGSSRSNVLPVLINASQCSYITEYMKLGGKNSASEVTKLQTFLRDVEKLDVLVNGSFDQKTFNAVKAFQAKYVTDVLAPWGASIPTGQVFYTTQKKINEIFCKTTFALTPAQMAEIEAYKKGSIKTAAVITTGSTSTTPVVEVSPEVGTTGSTSLDALTANASFGSKLKNFFKWLFGY